MMKIFLFILISFSLSGQITIDKNLDLAFDYYRGTAISWGTSEIINHFTKHPFLSGIIGLAIGTGQGLILERSEAGKIVSCMGSSAGSFCYIVRLDYKRKNIDTLKYKNL